MPFNIIVDTLEGREVSKHSTQSCSTTSRRVFINGSSISLGQIVPYQGQLGNKIFLIVDGTLSKCTDDRIEMTFMPAGTFNSIRNMIFNGTLSISHKYVVIHVGSSQVLENTRKAIIGQVLDLVAVIKAFYPETHIAFSGVLPRPIDHAQTGRAVIEFNHAIRTGVSVASSRYLNVKYLPHHHQFTDTEGQFIHKLFHKGQLRVSRKEAAVVMQNILKIIIPG